MKILFRLPITFILFLGYFPISLSAQTKISWEMLANVEYEFVHSEEYQAYYSKMIPSAEISTLNGEEVAISGFILPVSTDGQDYFLSAYPFSACFFCGGAGQESVIELRLANSEARYNVDDVMTFSGTLRLNDVPFEISYILENAQPVSQ